MEKCHRCAGTKFWFLATGQKRCSQCGLTRKFDRTGWDATRISPYWKGRLLEFFCLGVPVYRLRFQVPLNRKTIQRLFSFLRELIYEAALQELYSFSGEIELDEALFGGKCPGKRGWGAAAKHMVFGIYQRNGMVLTFPIPTRGKRDLIPLMVTHTTPGSLFYTDNWHAYTFLNIHGDHVVIRKERGRPKGRDHINGIEGFWSYAKHGLYHYRGVPQKHFHLYLKEIEWRFNHREENIIVLLRNLLNKSFIREFTE
jgi:transposase